MRAAIFLGSLLVVSSAFANNDALFQGSLEKFGATGLPQTETADKVSATRPAKVVSRVSKETQVSEGSLESFGATGLAQ
jgi:hypothetical protein